MRYLLTILFLIQLSFCDQNGFRKVIYGSDDRLDFFEVMAPMQTLGEGTVVIVFDAGLTNNGDGTFTAYSFNAEQTWGFCPNERFSQQDIIYGSSYCTGFLLSSRPGWIGTAGHCANSNSILGATVIFDFELISSGNTRLTFQASQIYTVSRVVVVDSVVDYAIIELDRDVVGRTPYSNVNNNVQIGESLTLIGHPAGLPKKFDSGGEVTALRSDTIRGTVDSYGGNSGSPVFDSNGNLVGILVAGSTDFVYDNGGNCDTSNICPGGPGCLVDGEFITPICSLLLSNTEVQDRLGQLCNGISSVPSTPTPLLPSPTPPPQTLTPSSTPTPAPPSPSPTPTPSTPPSPSSTPSQTPPPTPPQTPPPTPPQTPPPTPPSPSSTPPQTPTPTPTSSTPPSLSSTPPTPAPQTPSPTPTPSTPPSPSSIPSQTPTPPSPPSSSALAPQTPTPVITTDLPNQSSTKTPQILPSNTRTIQPEIPSSTETPQIFSSNTPFRAFSLVDANLDLPPTQNPSTGLESVTSFPNIIETLFPSMFQTEESTSGIPSLYSFTAFCLLLFAFLLN